MYLSHFNLKIKPFQISPDPKFLWLGETHREALTILRQGIQDNRGFLLLCGDIGTGKTTLINSLLEGLDDQTLIAMIADPDLEKPDFYNYLARQFGLQRTFQSKGDFLVHFIHFLHKTHLDGKKVLIVIDEAQRLRHELLEEIRQLSNIEKKDTKLLNIFLVGQHELIYALNETRNRALMQRIAMKYLIGPLKNADVGEYIAFRLKIAGATNRIFSAGAIRQVIAFSNGYPRLINIICDHALLTAYVKGKHRVDGGMVEDCAKDLHIAVETSGEKRSGGRFFDRVRDGLARPRQHPLPAFLVYACLVGVLALAVLSGLLFGGLVPDWLSERLSFAPVSQTASTPQSSQPGDQPPPAAAVSPPAAGQSSSTPEATTSSPDTVPPPQATRPPLPFKEKKYIIQFPPDSNAFSGEGYALLNRVIDLALAHGGLEIRVNGYTDASGDLAYNLRLSKFRANVVKSYLVGNGVAADDIVVAGLGPADPIAANDTPEGRQLNRRVEILLRSLAGSPDSP